MEPTEINRKVFEEDKSLIFNSLPNELLVKVLGHLTQTELACYSHASRGCLEQARNIFKNLTFYISPQMNPEEKLNRKMEELTVKELAKLIKVMTKIVKKFLEKDYTELHVGSFSNAPTYDYEFGRVLSQFFIAGKIQVVNFAENPLRLKPKLLYAKKIGEESLDNISDFYNQYTINFSTTIGMPLTKACGGDVRYREINLTGFTVMQVLTILDQIFSEI
ncbi:MAG: hypothetical protein K940chlam3_00977 [Chlamydiae bacterium]|nr:hypothetical protein [Chlamydiota bacterium]